MTQFTEAPIFDADQHMYETPDSLTKYLREKYSRAMRFVQIGKQTRIVINNKINDFMGDNARRFMGLSIANPDPQAVNPPALAHP